MERRRSAEGGITERKNKHRDVTGYQAQMRLPDVRRSHTSKTEREARKWLREAKVADARGTLTAKRPPTFTA